MSAPKQQTGTAGPALLRAWLRDTETLQKDLAERLGLHEATVSYWLSGRNVPLRDAAVALEKATGGMVPAASWPEEARGRNAIPGEPAPLSGQVAEDEAQVREILGTHATEKTLNALSRLAAAAHGREALLANNAALVRAARLALLDCAEPNGTFRTLIKAVQEMGAVVNQPHPGAALLEDLKKKDEGISAAVEALEYLHRRAMLSAHAGALVAAALRALGRLP